MPASKAVPVVQQSVPDYDVLTLTLGHCLTLTNHLSEQLDELADEEPNDDRASKLYALALITEHLREKQEIVGNRGQRLLDQLRGGQV